MLSVHENLPIKRSPAKLSTAAKLVGYALAIRDGSNTTAKNPTQEAVARLEHKAQNGGHRLTFTESDFGSSSNPYRDGFWRAVRRLVCSKCTPKRMPFSMMNFDDFLHQAFAPCYCGSEDSEIDGLVVASLEYISSDPRKVTAVLQRLSQMKKHLIADDGVCITCCHPAAKSTGWYS